MNTDAVFWGAVICVVGAVVVVAVLAVRISQKIKEDAERHSSQ